MSALTGSEVMLVVANETGHVYTFATEKLQPMITSESGKALIQTCLNSPDLPSESAIGTKSASGCAESQIDDLDESDGMDDDSSSSDHSCISVPTEVSSSGVKSLT